MCWCYAKATLCPYTVAFIAFFALFAMHVEHSRLLLSVYDEFTDNGHEIYFLYDESTQVLVNECPEESYDTIKSTLKW